MKKEFPEGVRLYDTMYDDNVPKNQYFVIKFDAIPSVYADGKTFYSKEILEYFLTMGFKVLTKNMTAYNNLRTIHTTYLLNVDKEIIIEVKYDSKEVDLLKITLTYNSNNGDIKDQIDFEFITKQFKKTKKRANINLMKKDMAGLDLEEFDIFVPETNLELNYGKDFLEIDKTIVKNLNIENGHGIVLLHGDPGTGKTTYLKRLSKVVKDKEIIFIPPSVAESLSEPSIIPFLMEHRNSVLIIEDAERVIGNREINGSEVAVSNILNLTDGILGECLGIQIIATFNMKKEKIDPALLRKGRLIAEHKFTALSVGDSNILLKHIGKDIVTTKPLTLADIYYIDVEEYKTTKESGKIGFH